jgi:hypothetical protein
VVDGCAKNKVKTLPEDRLAEVVAVIEKEAEQAKASVDTANIDQNA